MGREGTKLQRRFRRWVHGIIAVTAVFILIFSVAVGLLMIVIRTLPPIEQLENYSPPQATTIYDGTGHIKIATMAQQNRVVVPLDKMPRILLDAFISVEDKRFYRHFGVDLVRVAGAMAVNLSRGRLDQGGSTITQQLPRNLLKSVSRKKIYSRKIKETLLAFQIERRYSKDQILEFYLNHIYLGNGAYGVQAAARTFFNKDVSQLSVGECAVLAGIPQMPSRFSPINNIEASTRRRNIVLKLMREQGRITQAQYDDAASTGILLTPPPPASNLAPYFVEYTRRSLIDGGDFDNEGLYKDGYTIYTTIDMDLQKIADEELKKGLRNLELMLRESSIPRRLAEERANFRESPPVPRQIRFAKITRVFSDLLNVEVGGYFGTISLKDAQPYYHMDLILKQGEYIDIIPTEVNKRARTFFAEFGHKKPIQGAVVILDARTAEIKAMCGGENFYDFLNNGQWNRAAQGIGRQAGSAAKPFIFSGALESGYTLASMLNDRRIVFPDGYTPRNYENQYFGMTAIQTAIEHSRNVITILLYQDLKPARTISFMRRFDMFGERAGWHLEMNPTTVLGSFSATPLSIAASYIPFVHHGVGIRPMSVRKILDSDQKEVFRAKPLEREIISPQTAYQITYALKGVIKRGTGRKYIGEAIAGKEIPEIAGKTGTTNDCVDAWFVGYTPNLVICVWVGYDDNRSMGEAMTGGRVAAPIWRDIMLRAVELESYTDKTFPTPEGLVFADVCGSTGLLATERCRRDPDSDLYLQMPFKKGTEPKQSCKYH